MPKRKAPIIGPKAWPAFINILRTDHQASQSQKRAAKRGGRAGAGSSLLHAHDGLPRPQATASLSASGKVARAGVRLRRWRSLPSRPQSPTRWPSTSALRCTGTPALSDQHTQRSDTQTHSDTAETPQVIPPVLSLFTLLRPYLAHFFPDTRPKSRELRPSFDTAGARGRINWQGRRGR